MKIKLDLVSLGDDGFHIFCNVKVNGKKCRALVDTGASKTVISRNLAHNLNLPSIQLSDENRMTGIQPGEMDVAFTRVDSMVLGHMKFKDIVAGLVDMEHVRLQYKAFKIKPFKLIIGGDILYKGKAVIDYKNKVLKLSK